ncbi:MAG: hypothetical protein AAGH46_13285 [Bacteroidota bacterium]
MKRVIIDYKRLNHHLAGLLIELYPHGYGDDDIIVLQKPNGSVIEAVEIKTEDTIYLVKISQSLSNFISNFEENMEKELDKPKEASNATEISDSMQDLKSNDFHLGPEDLS